MLKKISRFFEGTFSFSSYKWLKNSFFSFLLYTRNLYAAIREFLPSWTTLVLNDCRDTLKLKLDPIVSGRVRRISTARRKRHYRRRCSADAQQAQIQKHDLRRQRRTEVAGRCGALQDQRLEAQSHFLEHQVGIEQAVKENWRLCSIQGGNQRRYALRQRHLRRRMLLSRGETHG